MIRTILIVLLISQSASAQSMLDWLGSTPAASASLAAVDAVAAMRSEVLAKQPVGKSAYIVAVCSADQFDAWLKRIDVVQKGWGVVRMDPKVDRPTAFVVISGSVTSLMNLPTSRDLNRVLMNEAKSRDLKNAPAANAAMEITIFKRPRCGWCDVWMRDEAPKARAAGAIVFEATEPDNSIPVPHFYVREANGQGRNFSGFTTFEGMK